MGIYIPSGNMGPQKENQKTFFKKVILILVYVQFLIWKKKLKMHMMVWNTYEGEEWSLSTLTF